MCTSWSQEQWLKETAKADSDYSLLGTYKNEKGEQALTVAEVGEQVRNVYSADGWSEQFFWYQFLPATEEWRENVPYAEQVQLAQEAMAKRGFTLATPSPTTQVEVQTEANVQSDDGVVRIQGKTLAEWDKEGELNEQRKEHVHPTPPKDRPPTEEETKAFVNSLTMDEAIFGLLSMTKDESSVSA